MSTIKFSSPTGSRIAVAAWDETILDAFLRSGAPVPFFCRSGLCGQCKSILVAGEVEPVGLPSYLLTEAEQQSGVVLLCSSRAVTDCEIQAVNNFVPSDAASWPATFDIERRVNVHAGLVQVRLRSTEPDVALSFRAGQSTRFCAPEFASLLPMFLASRPGLPYLDLYFSLEDHPSALVERLQPGAVVELSEPSGSASLRETEPGPVLVFAEGPGKASAVGMVEAIAALGPEAPTTAFVLRGAADGPLEHRVIGFARAAGIDASIAALADDVPAAIDKALTALKLRSSAGKVRAYVKACRDTVKAVRTVLLQHEVRPWDTHVDVIADRIQ
jgi:ferredoxin